MKRRDFLHALSLAAAPFACQAQALASTATPRLARTPLSLMAPRPDGCEAVWAVNQLSRGLIECQMENGQPFITGADSFGFVPQSGDVLRVRIDGLKPGASYRLRSITRAASGAEEISEWKSFRTLAPGAAGTRFVVWNDTHINNETIRKLDDATPAGDFMVWNGDTCNDWKSPDLLVPTLLHPGERDITTHRPLFLTYGNHDVRGPHAFEISRLIPAPEGRPFHAFRSGPVAAICLHTGEDKPDDHPSFGGRVAFDQLRREQAAWLQETICRPELRDAPYRLVFCHIPLRWTNETAPDYASGGFDHFSLRSREAWHRALVEWKAQLVISGHTHRAAHLPASADFPYAQITGGGPSPGAATWMLGEADGTELKLEVKALDGATRLAAVIKPLV